MRALVFVNLFFFSRSIGLSGREIIWWTETKNEIRQAELLTIPHFVRFNTVVSELDYSKSSKPIKGNCEWIQKLLRPIKHAMKGAILVFRGTVSHPLSVCSTDHSMLLTHIKTEFLQICNSCRSYKFEISFLSFGHSAATNVMSKILQFGPIYACSKVQLLFLFFDQFDERGLLPVDSITNWLNRRSRNSTVFNANEKMEEERILEIEIKYCAHAPNISEMINVLKKVDFNYKFNFNYFLKNLFHF